MSILFYLVQTNFINIAIVLFLYIFLTTGTTMSKFNQRIFVTATIILFAMILADATDYYLYTSDEVHLLRYITSAAGYTLRPIEIFLMILIAKRFDNIRTALFSVPIVVNGVMAFTSVFTHLMFYFDNANKFHRGPFGILPFVVCGFYLIFLLITSIKKYRIGNRVEASVVVFIVIMLALASAMETLFGFKFFINGVGGISITFYYAFLNTQTYKRDAMTSALNRHSFYADSVRLSKKSMVVVSIDLNNLKLINDTKGHEAGDAAILSTARTIFKHLPARYQLYRIGGDEFTMLCPKAKMSDVEKIMDKIIIDANVSGYTLAWGADEYFPGMKFEDVLALSDKKMYENKKAIKQRQILNK